MLSDDERRSEREQAEVFALLGRLDHAPRHIGVEAVAARARAGEAGIQWRRWAAGIVLVAGLTGVAYAMPGSPFPAWARALSEWIRGGPEMRAPDAAPMPAASDASVAGIAVRPGRNLMIVFTMPASESEARISLTDGDEVMVRAPQGAARFTSDLDRLVIDNRGPASAFEIEIPRSAPRVEIRVHDERIFFKEGDSITPAMPDAGGMQVTRLIPAE
jgi:hypothetical protein